MKLLFPGSGPG